jgi:hypothetical protein
MANVENTQPSERHAVVKVQLVFELLEVKHFPNTVRCLEIQFTCTRCARRDISMAILL